MTDDVQADVTPTPIVTPEASDVPPQPPETAEAILPADLSPLRVLLVLDNLAGHKSVELVTWLLAHGFCRSTRRSAERG